MTYKLELKSCHEVIDTVNVANVDSIFHGKPIYPDILTVVMKDGKRLYCDEVCLVDSRQEEPVSEELDEVAKHYLYSNILYDDVYVGNPTDKDCIEMFKAGAEWQKNQGVTKEAVIGMATEEISINISKSTLDALDLCAGDKVIIQIRKKED